MPVIRPFRGLRYDQEIIGDLRNAIAPPYDIIYDEWRERLYARNPYNVIRLIKAHDEPGDTPDANKYTRSGELLNSWIRQGVLTFNNKPAIYVTSDTFTVEGKQHTRMGFISLMKIEEFGHGVYPHERTLSAPKLDRLNLLKATKTNFSQVFSVYRDPEGDIQEILLNVMKTSPSADFTDEQEVTRRMWVVTDTAIIGRIRELMQGRDVIIADGHHRYETALAYRQYREDERTSPDEPFDYTCMYFANADDPGTVILPTHRKANPPQFDPQVFIRELAIDFEVVEQDNIPIPALMELISRNAREKNTFGIYTDGKFYTATNKQSDSPKVLDVEVLQNIILDRRLGITPELVKEGKYLHFTQSPEHACADVDAGKDRVALFLNAISTEELFRVVLQGKRLPQKSTYFYPKTLSGLVMYRIDRESL